MLSRLFPLGVKVSFEDRVYKLGETIDLTVELSPKRDMEVREGRVDLVCEESYQETFTVTGNKPHAAGDPRPAGHVEAPLPSMVDTRQVTERRRESYVHSSVVFLEDTRLASGRTGSYNAKIEIEPEPPPHAGQGKVRWRLVTTTDVAGARDIKARRLVKVT